MLVIEEPSRLVDRRGLADLRSFIFLSRLQPQTMCYPGTWIRGSLPRSHTVNLSTDEGLAVFVARRLDGEARTREDL